MRELWIKQNTAAEIVMKGPCIDIKKRNFIVIIGKEQCNEHFRHLYENSSATDEEVMDCNESIETETTKGPS